MSTPSCHETKFLTFKAPTPHFAKVGHTFGDALCCDVSATMILRFFFVRLWLVRIRFCTDFTKSVPDQETGELRYIYPEWKGGKTK